MTDPRLRIPLAKLWPAIRVPGLPVWRGRNAVLIDFAKAFPPPDSVVVCTDYGGHWNIESNLPYLDQWAACDVDVDLGRPGASDILARRVATALKVDWCDWSPLWDGCVLELKRDGYPLMIVPDDNPDGYGDFGTAICLPEMESVRDIPEGLSLDWPNLQGPGVRYLAALGMLAQHLYAPEQQ